VTVKKVPIPEQLQDVINQLNKRAGPTGKPGELGEMDQGELAVAVGQENGQVVITFGKPVAWVSLRPDQADIFCATVQAMAARIRRGE